MIQETYSYKDEWRDVNDGNAVSGQEYLTYTPETENTVECYRLISYKSTASGFPLGVTHYKKLMPPDPKNFYDLVLATDVKVGQIVYFFSGGIKINKSVAPTKTIVTKIIDPDHIAGEGISCLHRSNIWVKKPIVGTEPTMAL